MFSRKDSRRFDECLRLDEDGDGRRPKFNANKAEGRNPFIFKEEKGKKTNKPRHGALNLNQVDLAGEATIEDDEQREERAYEALMDKYLSTLKPGVITAKKEKEKKQTINKEVVATSSVVSNIQVGQLVRLKEEEGLYKGDLAQVDSLDVATNQVCLRLVPRIDYSRLRGALPARTDNEAAVAAVRSSKRVAAKLFDLKAVRASGGEVSTDGDGFTIFEANRYRGGFLYQKFSLSSVYLDGITLTAKQLKKLTVHPSQQAIQMQRPYEVEMAMPINRKHLHLLVARRAAVCRQLYKNYGGITVSFPPTGGKTTTSDNRLLLKGAPECVQAAMARIDQMIADYVILDSVPAVQGKAGKKTKKAKAKSKGGGGGANAQHEDGSAEAAAAGPR